MSPAPRNGNALNSRRNRRRRFGGCGLISTVTINFATICRDRCPVSSLVSVAVGVSSGVVGDSHGL